MYKVQVYKGIEQGNQVSITAITKICAFQSNSLHPLLSTMPRANQAKAAEPKKRLASNKWISEEEMSPKKAKGLKDSDKNLANKVKAKPGVLDKCVFCSKYGVRCLLEGAGSATNNAGVAHHLVEKVMQEEAVKTPALKEVLEEVTKVRVAAGIDLDDLPEPFREEIHNCLLCAGKDKDGLNLSLDPGKLWNVRYHYAACYFDTGVYQSLGGSYLPGDQNSNEDGSARDVMGREVKYRCMEAGCTMKRQVP